MNPLIALADQGRLPDSVIRRGIRLLNRQRLWQEQRRAAGDRDAALDRFITGMAQSPIALVPDTANDQHYEVPTEFFKAVLGRHMKYSSGYWAGGADTLDASEAAMLALTCQRAGIEDGMRILELGCGWGSLTLWMAHHYPGSEILAVSNSATQRRHIEARAAKENLANVKVVTADMNNFDPRQFISEAREATTFQRVVSVEMFEHMRNWPRLLSRIAGWLAPGGKLFIHIFSHRDLAYAFEVRSAGDWMGRYFFTGGIMPAHGLLQRIEGPLKVEQQWRVNGRHYQKTAEAWLAKMDRNKDLILPIMGQTYGSKDAGRWFQRWRIFFMACAELFGHDR
ncbi:MAG: cyclopropane-fatty-acyl-phospholipid synthase family protein, partial [Desulfobacterales bacterium]